MGSWAARCTGALRAVEDGGWRLDAAPSDRLVAVRAATAGQAAPGVNFQALTARRGLGSFDLNTVKFPNRRCRPVKESFREPIAHER